MRWTDSVTVIPYVSDKYQQKLARLEIHTVGDLLTHFPRYHKDNSDISDVSDILDEGKYTIEAKPQSLTSMRLRGKRTLQKGILSDESGSVPATWFNQPWLAKQLSANSTYLFSGNVKNYRGTLTFFPNSYEKQIAGKENVHLGRISPQYPLTSGIGIKWIRKRIKFLLDNLDLLEEIHKLQVLLAQHTSHQFNLERSLQQIHFPDTEAEMTQSRDELQLLELTNLQLKILEQESKQSIYSSPVIKVDQKLINQFRSQLPFDLTADQQTSLSNILEEIADSKPMNRLLQGDVGTGKTIVAIATALAVVRAGYQVIVLAPTTVLAEQHFANFRSTLQDYNLSIELVTSAQKDTKPGQIMIGTSAVIARQAELIKNLGLVVVDEQHRFGVKQREELIKPFMQNVKQKQQNKASNAKKGAKQGQKNASENKLSAKATSKYGIEIPHLLTMTATPIPRTLAKAIFSNLEVSDIKTKPAGRLPVKTFVVPEAKRSDGYDWIRSKINDTSQQVYWVCPIIDESDTMEINSAKEIYQQLSAKTFSNFNVDLMHGRLANSEKATVMQRFSEGHTDILVSTSVIEVGVDVPNATVMVIEGAERFGMAQLHQIRGRVGRSDQQSWCFLFPSENVSDEANERLKFFSNHNDGLEIAEYDLERRGPGEVYGTRQSGIPNLKIANLTDLDKVKQSRKIAEQLYQHDIKQLKVFELPSLEGSATKN